MTRIHIVSGEHTEACRGPSRTPTGRVIRVSGPQGRGSVSSRRSPHGRTRTHTTPPISSRTRGRKSTLRFLTRGCKRTFGLCIVRSSSRREQTKPRLRQQPTTSGRTYSRSAGSGPHTERCSITFSSWETGPVLGRDRLGGVLHARGVTPGQRLAAPIDVTLQVLRHTRLRPPSST